MRFDIESLRNKKKTGHNKQNEIYKFVQIDKKVGNYENVIDI